jgi:hypothetical protein
VRAPRPKGAPALLAEALAGSWRASPPAPTLSCDELARVAPLLVGSGGAALACWKVRGSSLRACAAAEILLRSYRRQALQSALQEWEVEHVFALLRSAGVEPVLLKGWAAAGLYPERGLRPPGDIDLCVRPGQYAAARAALWGRGRKGAALTDLDHEEFSLLGDGGWDGLYARSRVLKLNESGIRVLGREDQMRFLCLHLLRHSAYRPVWLCDVAAALESASAGFDWGTALGGDALRRNWVGCVIDLARRLLGARPEDLPEEVSAARAPPWLVAEVLRQWERPTTAERVPRELMAVSLRHPARALPALMGRWPDPIRALVGLRQPFDGRARLPRQLKFFAARSAAFLGRPLRRADKL